MCSRTTRYRWNGGLLGSGNMLQYIKRSTN
jgi:hypothetical protein